MDFEELSRGSKFHTVRVLSEDQIYLAVADVTSDECLRGFQKVVAEAERQGYLVKPHRYTQRSLPDWHGSVYDTAFVSRE